MNGWWALAGGVVLAAVAGGREYARWRGRRWQGGLRSGARPNETNPPNETNRPVDSARSDDVAD